MSQQQFRPIPGKTPGRNTVYPRKKSAKSGKGCLITLGVIVVVFIVLARLGGTESAQWDTAKRKDDLRSYSSFVKSFPSGPHTQEAKTRLTALNREAEGLWKQLQSYPNDSQLFLYLTKYSSSDDAAADYFTRTRIIGAPYEKEYVEGLRSSDHVRRANYCNLLAEHGQRAMYFTPYIIDVLDDNTPLKVTTGYVYGPTTHVGYTTVSEDALFALKRITSQDFGYNKEAWTAWWTDWWTKNREKLR